MNLGFLFSRNAVTPSTTSSVLKSRPKRLLSSAMPAHMLVSMPI